MAVYFCSHKTENYPGGTDNQRACLSQWFPSSFVGGEVAMVDLKSVIGAALWDEFIAGKEFANCEQWMMLWKALIFHDKNIAKQIVEAALDPKTIRTLGRKVSNYVDSIWEHHRYNVVLAGNFLKFSQNNRLRDYLVVGTGEREIVEAAHYDRIWGIGFTEADAEKNRHRWGRNLLGKALMEVRQWLKVDDGDN